MENDGFPKTGGAIPLGGEVLQPVPIHVLFEKWAPEG